MTQLLLTSLKVEYETTDITIEDLCAKHSTTPDELTWWPLENDPKAPVPEVVEESSETRALASQIPTLSKKDTTTATIDPTIKDDIATFKRLAVDHALTFIKTQAQFSEVKEFKDVVAVIDSIDKSLQEKPGSNSTPVQVNVMVQSIMQGFTDDC